MTKIYVKNRSVSFALMLAITLALLVGLALLLPANAHAASLVVTSNADSGAGSLREAVSNAASGDIITFAPEVTSIALNSALAFSDKSLTIDGGSAGVTLTVTGTGYRHINFVGIPNTLTVKNVVFDGAIPGRSEGQYSGGVHCGGGSLMLENATVKNCAAANGGGVFASDTVMLLGCTITGNSATNNGGGVYASDTAALQNCTLSGNSAAFYGGGVRANVASLSCCTVTGNTALIGGGVWGHVSISLKGSIVSGNTADGSPGELYIVNTTIENGDGTLVANDSLGSYYIVGVPAGGLSAILETSGGAAKLADNGGSTQTVRVAPGGPAMNAVPAASFTTWGITADQRGLARPTTGKGTVGAVELRVSSVPEITTQPQAVDVIVGNAADALTVAATGDGALTYQWYSNATDSAAGGTKLDGATGSSYTPPSNTVGAMYYYVVVTNTGAEADLSASLVSGTAKVTVSALTVDTAALEQAISKALLLKKDGYTDESWNALQGALTEAQALVNDQTATQQGVDAAAKKLTDAIAALKEKAAPTPSPTPSPKPQPTQTGDMGALPYIIALLVCGGIAGVLIFTKRRKKQ